MKIEPKTALFISPHLDDAAFSCGGTMLKMAAENWRTILCTIFTKSVLQPEGFALACQTDKGLSREVDYLAMRRAEDLNFARSAHVAETIFLDFSEAPHRGYDSAAELFDGEKTGDEIWREIVAEFEKIAVSHTPQMIFAPQGIGNHVDHLQTIRAILASDFNSQIFWYRDTPYALKNPDAAPFALLSDAKSNFAVNITETIEAKIDGCAQYETQIGFQFGGRENLANSLRDFHQAEARRSNSPYEFAEVFSISEITFLDYLLLQQIAR